MDIFVSYAREDRDHARLLAGALERRGWSVFWDTDILPGDSFREVIGEKLAAAGCVLVLWSSHSVDSRWVLDEAREGLERRVLVPIMSEEVDIPLGFGGQQTADLTNWRGDDEHPGFRQIVSASNRAPVSWRPTRATLSKRATDNPGGCPASGGAAVTPW